MTDYFAGKRALILGGLGFIGSNLAIELVRRGAEVTLVDAMIPGYGGNLFNIEPIKDQVTINFSDIRDQNTINYLVRDQDFVFHLARQVDHVLSLSDPFPDIDINIRGTAVVMEACKHHNPDAKVIFTGTRGQYGEAVSLPVDENAPTNPKGLHEISSLTAEKIIHMYYNVHHIRSVLLRITNVYGARAQMQHPRYGVVNWFVRTVIDDGTIKVFGDGSILRDFLSIDDCIDAILQCASVDATWGEIFNVATGKPVNFVDLADTLVQVANSGRWEFAPFSPERAAQEPGDFFADINKIKQIVGWEPTTCLDDGLRQTVEYFRKYKQHYW